MPRGLLLLAAVAALLAALLLYTHAIETNRGSHIDLKPGAIITAEEVKKLEERGWKLVEAEQLYKLYGFTAVYGRCESSLLLVDRLKPTHWDPLMKPMLGRPFETLRLSSVANATIYYKPAKLYYAHRAYCLEKLDNTTYKVTGLIKHAYIGESKGKPHKMVLRIDKKHLEGVLEREWCGNVNKTYGPAVAKWLLEELRIFWKHAEKRVCGVTVDLDVPIISASSDWDAYYPDSFIRYVVIPLAKLLGKLGICPPSEAVRARYWIEYNVGNERSPWPPNWVVYGGVCWQWAEWTRRALRLLGLPAAYLLVQGNPRHASTVLCTGLNKPIPFQGGYYGLLAVSDNGTKIVCWLYEDTGWIVNIWERIPKLGATITFDYYRGAPYRVVATWVGKTPPSNLYK